MADLHWKESEFDCLFENRLYNPYPSLSLAIRGWRSDMFYTILLSFIIRRAWMIFFVLTVQTLSTPIYCKKNWLQWDKFGSHRKNGRYEYYSLQRSVFWCPRNGHILWWFCSHWLTNETMARMLNGTQYYAQQTRVRHSTLRTTGNSAALDTPLSIL